MNQFEVVIVYLTFMSSEEIRLRSACVGTGPQGEAGERRQKLLVTRHGPCASCVARLA